MHLMGPERVIRYRKIAALATPSHFYGRIDHNGTLRASPSTIPSSWTLWRPMFRRFTSGRPRSRDPGYPAQLCRHPDSDTQTAGVQFNVRLTALDPYKNATPTSPGPNVSPSAARQRPSGTTPIIRNRDLWSGQLGRHLRQRIRRRRNVLSVKLFDAESAD